MADSASLSNLKLRFSDWRSKRVIGERIPDSLWKAAAKAAQKWGVNRVATSLRLDYYAVKKRAEAENQVTDDVGQLSFVEVQSGLTDSVSIDECTIEFEKASGDKMRIHFRGSLPADFASLGRNFWGSD